MAATVVTIGGWGCSSGEGGFPRLRVDAGLEQFGPGIAVQRGDGVDKHAELRRPVDVHALRPDPGQKSSLAIRWRSKTSPIVVSDSTTRTGSSSTPRLPSTRWNAWSRKHRT